jgi:hypothetical protein
MDSNVALKEAMKLIDPEGLLGKSSGDRDRIEKMVAGWVDCYGIETTLRMAERSNRYLKAWKRVRG